MRRLAYNLYWTWHPGAKGLFARISSATWARTHSPSVLAGMVDWAALLDNPDFMVEAQRVIADFDRYLAERGRPLFHRRGAIASRPIAYFCAEYGLHESLGIYSGGLGVSPATTEVGQRRRCPCVGVGLLYRNGYFRQTIDADGHQEHRHRPARLPICARSGAR